jgi:hypothetical protein
MVRQQPCKHRKKEYCNFSGRPCFGAKRDEETEAYKVDFWAECTCPQYEASEDVAALIQKEPSQLSKERGDIVIRIFGPMEAGEQCSDDCVVETVDLQADILQRFFNRRYGDKVRVEGIDITSEIVGNYPAVGEYVKKGVSHVVMINDEVKFSGGVDLGALKQEIRKLGVREIKP